MLALSRPKSTPLFAVVAVVALLALAGAGALAQGDSTSEPVPNDWGIPGFEALGDLADPSLAPGMVLELSRLTWEPGFTLPMHTHPSNDVVYVLAGEVAWSVESGTAQITRAAVEGTPGPTETLEPGAEAVIGPGDVIFMDHPKTGMLHSPRVVGDVPVVMLLATIYDPSQPLTVYPDDAGTPAS